MKATKYLLLLLFIIICSNVTTLLAFDNDTIFTFKKNIFKSSFSDISPEKGMTEKIQTPILIIQNIKLDSILLKNESYLSKKFKITPIWKNLFIVFVKSDSILYFEIGSIMPTIEIFDIKNTGKTSSNYLEKDDELYGYTKINDWNVYIFLRNSLGKIKEKEIGSIVTKSTNLYTIIKEKQDPTIYNSKIENPMWLYKYQAKIITLIKSVNTEDMNQ